MLGVKWPPGQDELGQHKLDPPPGEGGGTFSRLGEKGWKGRDSFMGGAGEGRVNIFKIHCMKFPKD